MTVIDLLLVIQIVFNLAFIFIYVLTELVPFAVIATCLGCCLSIFITNGYNNDNLISKCISLGALTGSTVVVNASILYFTSMNNILENIVSFIINAIFVYIAWMAFYKENKNGKN